MTRTLLYIYICTGETLFGMNHQLRWSLLVLFTACSASRSHRGQYAHQHKGYPVLSSRQAIFEANQLQSSDTSAHQHYLYSAAQRLPCIKNVVHIAQPALDPVESKFSGGHARNALQTLAATDTMNTPRHAPPIVSDTLQSMYKTITLPQSCIHQGVR